jgi:phosphonatase-like hydrolase
MDIDLVVFDMAGTTVNDDDSVNRCLRAALGAVGLTVVASDVNAVMGLKKTEAIVTLIERSGQFDSLGGRIDSIHRDFVARCIEFYERDPSVHEVPGATGVFKRLRGNGIRVALDTGFDRSIARVILERLGWSDGGLIDASICSDEVARGRPNPDMILRLMAELGIAEPQRVAKVGDTPADLHEGFNAGCGLVVGVTRGTHTREQLERHPHTHLIETIALFPGLVGLSP